jgi:hypothetical protein
MLEQKLKKAENKRKENKTRKIKQEDILTCR